MSKRLPPVLTNGLMELLNGERIEERLDRVLLLVTLDEAGWPYVAMLSYLEVTAADSANLRIAPWNASTTTENLRRAGKATLILVDEEMAFYIQATAQELSRELEGFAGMAKINLHIESILEDRALDYEGAARVTTGIRFENPALDDNAVQRGRRVLEALRR